MSICLALVSTVCLIGYWLQMMRHMFNKRFNNGFSQIKSDIQLTLFLNKAMKLISKDQKKH